MIDLEIEVEDKLIKELLDELSPRKIKAALKEASRRAADLAKTEGKRLIAKQYKPLKQSEVGEAIHVSQRADYAAAVFFGARLPLYKFGPVPSVVMGGKTTGGVSALIGGARLQFPHAFNAKVQDEINIYQRQRLGKGSDRRKLRKLTTLAIPEMAEDEMHNQAISNEISSKMLERFETRFLQQLERHLLEGRSKK